MASPLGYPLGLGACLEPGRDARVPQVVRMPGKGRGDLGVGERDEAGFGPHPAVVAFREVAAAQAAEQAAIGGRAVLVQVFEDQADERWRDWYWADRAFRPVLELAFLTGSAGVAPGAADPRRRALGELAAPAPGAFTLVPPANTARPGQLIKPLPSHRPDVAAWPL